MQKQMIRLSITGFLFLISGISTLQAKEFYMPKGLDRPSSRTEVYYDTAKRDKYLKPINARLIKVQKSIKLLGDMVQTNIADTTVKKLSLAELYSEYFTLEQSRKELISEYYKLQAKRDALTVTAKNLQALKHLVDLAIQAPLDAGIRDFIEAYLEKNREDRVLAAMELNAIIDAEPDASRKEALRALRAVLLGQGLASTDDTESEAAMRRGFEGLRILAKQNSESLAAIADFVQGALDEGANDLAQIEQDINTVRSENEGRADFARIDGLSAKVFELERQVTHNSDYTQGLQKQIAELKVEVAALNDQKKKAPKPVKKTRRVSSELY